MGLPGLLWWRFWAVRGAVGVAVAWRRPGLLGLRFLAVRGGSAARVAVAWRLPGLLRGLARGVDLVVDLMPDLASCGGSKASLDIVSTSGTDGV